jgi:hypothetical protein
MTRAFESASTVEVRSHDQSLRIVNTAEAGSHDQSLRIGKHHGVRSRRDGATEELRNQADGHP